MSTSLHSSVPTPETSLQPRIAVALACLCAATGLFTVYSSVRLLLDIWSTDDLKSMGLVVPFVCFGLILRAWKRIGWETAGSWWGFAVLMASAALVFLHDQTLFLVTVNKNWMLQLPPLPLVAVLYATSLVLLFGGKRLLRAAWFPVLLMWAVIPVPSTFANRIDLPLQHASAHVARAFAHLLGQQLTEDKLRLMFTPEYGMFIAPGCNGIRGAITLGLAALIVSYLYRFRWWLFPPVIAGAVLLGYLFNFLRLCLLVVYYRLTLHAPWFQVRAKMADYLIGGTLFLCALVLFFAVANKLRRDPDDTTPEPPAEPVHAPVSPRSYLARVAAMLLVSAIFAGDLVHVLRAERFNNAYTAAPQELPAALGPTGAWRRVRSWNDTLLTGWIVYTWGEYALTLPDGEPDPTQPHISLGISPRLGIHDAQVCHTARGEEPAWQSQLTDPGPARQNSPAGPVTTFNAALYNNGRVQRLEAATVCQGASCREFSGSNQHVSFIMARPDGRLPLQTTTGPVPMLLKVESKDTVTPSTIIGPQLAAQLARFVHDVDLPAVALPYSHRR